MFKNWQVWATVLGLGLALFVGGWSGKWAYNASNQPTPDSPVWFIRVGVVVMLVGGAGVLASLFQRRALPKLEIVIGAEPEFRQERRFPSNEGFPTKQTLYRVGIRHDGHATVDNVSVDLESMKPHSLRVPLRLHQMNDNRPIGQSEQDFSLDADQTKHIDVVLKQDDDDEQPTRDRVLLYLRARGIPSRLSIFHIVPGVSQDIPVERHEIVIFAHGRDAKPVRRNFIIDVDDNGALQFASA